MSAESLVPASGEGRRTPARKASRRGVAARVLLLAGLAVGVHELRAGLASQFQKLKLVSDVYALPKPEQAVVASLGYRSALADVLYAHVLVSSGIHLQERRRFEFVGHYLETINELDPKFRDPYRFADTLLTLQGKPPSLDEYRKARQILERGLRELPYDGQLWVTAGQYVGYLAVGRLESEEEKQEWRLTGARWLSRACELVGDARNLPFHCITAAGLLSRAGKQAASVEFMKRVLAVNDDPEVRQIALRFLGATLDKEARANASRRDELFSELARSDAPFLDKELLLLLGPRVSPLACAGPELGSQEGCWSSFEAWGRSLALEEAMGPQERGESGADAGI